MLGRRLGGRFCGLYPFCVCFVVCLLFVTMVEISICERRNRIPFYVVLRQDDGHVNLCFVSSRG